MENTITETTKGRVVRKVNDTTFEVVIQSEKVEPINVADMLQVRANHVAAIARIDADLALASAQGVTIA